MSRRLRIVKDDTQVIFTVDLIDQATGVPINVSGNAVVVMYTRLDNTTTILDTITGQKLPARTLEDGTLDLTVTSPGAGGRVQFSLPVQFTSREPGLYEGEIEITHESGLIQTIYDPVKFSIRADF